MSWQVCGIGKAAALRAEIKRQFEKGGKCIEPEESVRQAAAAQIDTTLAAYDPECVAEVNASGSQYYQDWNTKAGVQNVLTIQVSPKGHFVS